MSKDSKGKPMSWLKGVIYDNSAEESSKEQPITSEAQDLIQESKLPNDSHDNSVFSKDNQDKVTLDLIVSMENMLKIVNYYYISYQGWKNNYKRKRN